MVHVLLTCAAVLIVHCMKCAGHSVAHMINKCHQNGYAVTVLVASVMVSIPVMVAVLFTVM